VPHLQLCPLPGDPNGGKYEELPSHYEVVLEIPIHFPPCHWRHSLLPMHKKEKRNEPPLAHPYEGWIQNTFLTFGNDFQGMQKRAGAEFKNSTTWFLNPFR